MFEVTKVFAGRAATAHWAKKFFPEAEVEIRKLGDPNYKFGDSDRYVFDLTDGEREFVAKSCSIGTPGYPDEVLACVPLRRFKAFLKNGKLEAMARRSASDEHSNS